MSEIRADLSQYYPLKALIEQTLGRKSFSRVKDYAPLPVWKSEISRLIKALAVAAAPPPMLVVRSFLRYAVQKERV